jgi:hypothetical protein
MLIKYYLNFFWENSFIYFLYLKLKFIKVYYRYIYNICKYRNNIRYKKFLEYQLTLEKDLSKLNPNFKIKVFCSSISSEYELLLCETGYNCYEMDIQEEELHKIIFFPNYQWENQTHILIKSEKIHLIAFLIGAGSSLVATVITKIIGF